MKKTSDLILEIMGETGDERLADVYTEVAWMERANTKLILTMYRQGMDSRQVIADIEEGMKKALSPARYKESEAGAKEVIDKFGSAQAAAAAVAGRNSTPDPRTMTKEQVNEKLREMFKGEGL